MNIFVFDIETIPDTNAGRQFHDFSTDLSDQDVSDAMFKLQREKSGSDFLPHYLHKIVAISVVLRTRDQVKVWSLGDEDSSEAELLQRFFAGLTKFNPCLVSWNGGAFDLPVIHYRSLRHGISAPSYWETGDTDQNYRWNNYISRYHNRHTDLMDVLAAYQPRAFAPLDKIATMLGFPGKMGMDGAKVCEQYQQGEIAAIRNYCETDVLNTYLVYLRFQFMRGKLTEQQHVDELELLQSMLAESEQQHLQQFAEIWQKNAINQ